MQSYVITVVFLDTNKGVEGNRMVVCSRVESNMLCAPQVKAFYAAMGTMMGDKAQTVMQQHSSTTVQHPQQDQQRPARHRIGT